MSIDQIDNRTIVRFLYRALLNREPDPQGLAFHVSRLESGAASLHQVGLGFVESDEFAQQEQVRSVWRKNALSPMSHPYQSWNRQAVAVIHVRKTGGTTLYSLLSQNFPMQRICPEHFDGLHLYTPAQLADYDLFFGHFDYFSVRLIPRERVRRVSIFRDPDRRLISWYRFMRSHRPTGDDPNIKLANELNAEEFFEHQDNLSSTLVNNSYLYCFGSSLCDSIPASWPCIDPAENGSDSKTQELLARAVGSVLDLDGVGLTERFTESVELILSSLGFPVPEVIVPENVTDENTAPPVKMTPRLSRALERLTRYDRVIYGAAKREFERRLALQHAGYAMPIGAEVRS